MQNYSVPAADPQLAEIKLPPHSVEAEQSVLGGILLDTTAWDKIADLISEQDFYRFEHRLIWRHIARLTEQAKPVDVITVAEALESNAELDKAGGLAYLGTLAHNVPSAANIRRYAEIVRERSIMRRLAEVGGDISTSAYNPAGRDARQLLDEAESKVFEISEAGERGKQGFVAMPPLLTQVVQRIETLYGRDNAGDVTGIATGFTDLDRMTSGLQPGDLVIVAGRPSMGKAQPLDSHVRTLNGWKQMGKLEVGDALASVDGRPSMVTGVFPQGLKQVYRITFSDGRSAECCAEHLWRVHSRHWDSARVLETRELMRLLQSKRHQGRIWIKRPSGDFGHHDPLPIDPWVLGALLGDGNLTGTGSVRFSTASPEILALMEERIEHGMMVTHAQNYDYRLIRRDRGRQPGLQGAQPNPLRVGLEALQLSGLSSDQKFIPQLYLEACRPARLDLLRGLLDTDGWVERWGSVRFSTSSARLALEVAALVRSLGGWCSISKKQPHFRNIAGMRMPGLPAYVCNISHPEPRSLFMLSEKQLRAPATWRRQKRLNILSIEPVREAPCQCISVSHPDRLYITDQDVVTHNTAFSINIAEHVALEVSKPVAIFSMEMGGTQLAMRMIGSVGKLNQHTLRTGKLEDDDWSRMTHALGRLNDAPIFIDETAALNSLELRSRARRLHRQNGGLGLIVIDYIQLMSSTSSKGGENRATEISEISRSLKALAKELQVPVIALSQLNRSLEQRPNKRPIMSDLRESGAIEQDADLILFIYRDEVYNPDTPEKGSAEIIIGKQRNGPIGTIGLTFRGEFTRFENAAHSGQYHSNE
ncbi:MAG: replicative DNA helicase [Nitrosomonadales bacterium]|nr:replicative DNA helicase [Nitrosomonadales bacterium]